MFKAYGISCLSEREETTGKEVFFTIVNKILKVIWKGCYIKDLSMR